MGNVKTLVERAEFRTGRILAEIVAVSRESLPGDDQNCWGPNWMNTGKLIEFMGSLSSKKGEANYREDPLRDPLTELMS